MGIRCFLCFGFLFTCASTRAAEYYVSPTGDQDGPGTKGAPWGNLQDSTDRLKPGDTLFVKPGVYREKIYINVSGAPDKPITIQGEPGAIISGRMLDDENLIYIEDKSHIRIIGLELRDNLKCKDGSGIRIYGSGSHIELRNNKIHNIRGKDAMGITVYGTNAKTPVSHVVIDGNEIYDCEPAESEALTLNGNVSNFVVSNNKVHDCNNIGIDFIGGEDWVTQHPDAVTRDGICKGNLVYRCRSTYGGGYAAGIYVDGGRNIVIEENIISECDLGIEIGAENKGTTTTGITVKNNIIFHNDKAGLVFGGYEKDVGRVEKCTFTGNTCYENARHKKDHNGEIWIQWATGNEVTGNTIVSSPSAPVISVDVGGVTGNTVDTNKLYTATGETMAFFLWGGEDVEGLAAWRTVSKMDAQSVFGPVEVKLPTIPPPEVTATPAAP